MTQTPAPTPQPSAAKSAVGIVGGLGGAALGLYCGVHMLIPAVGVGVLLLIFNKTALRPQHFRVSIAVIGGHLLWMAFGGVFTGAWGAVAYDLILFGAGLVWLAVWPGLPPVVTLIALAAFALVVNLMGLLDAPPSSVQSKALVVHCLLRLLAIGCLIGEYVQMRRGQTAEFAPPTDSPPFV